MALGDITLITEIALSDVVRELSCVHVSGGVVATAHKIDGTNAYRISTYTIGTDGSISSAISTQDIAYTSGAGASMELSQIFKVADGMYAVLLTWKYQSGDVIVGLGAATIGITNAGVVDSSWTDTLDIKLNAGHTTADNKYAYTVIQIGLSDFFATPYTFSYADGGATTYKQMLVVIEINSAGAISNAVSDELELGTTGNGEFSSICHVSGDIYAVAWTNVNTQTISTIDISSTDGSISTVASSTSVYTDESPKLAKADNGKYVLAQGSETIGEIVSFAISDDGVTIGAIIDNKTWESTDGRSNWLLKLFTSTDAYFVVTGKASNHDGWARTFRVNPDGAITLAVVSKEFYLGTTFHTETIFVRYDGTKSSVYLITYKGTGTNGFLETISIESGVQFPTGDLTRITGLIHRYWPDHFRLECILGGGLSGDFASGGRVQLRPPLFWPGLQTQEGLRDFLTEGEIALLPFPRFPQLPIPEGEPDIPSPRPGGPGRPDPEGPRGPRPPERLPPGGPRGPDLPDIPLPGV